MDSLARPIPVSAPGSAPHMEYPEDPSFHSPHDGRVEMSQDEIDAIIRNKRKLRDPKACYACHRRKVKCDRNLPCDSCIKRDHPELCSYERPTKRRRIALPGVAVQPDAGHSDGPDAFVLNSGPNVTVPKEQWERVQRELQQLREAVKGPHSPLQSFAHDDTEEHLHTAGSGSRDETEREGIHAESKQMGTMHLGSKSVLAYMMGLGRTKSTQDAARSLLEKDILPNLGLDNDSATYPFVDLWSTESSMQDVDGLCRAIPEDRLCREFFIAYRDVAATIYPVIPCPDEFEATLNFMLASRARWNWVDGDIDSNKPFGVPMPWLALCFAVLASGAQCTSRDAKERELTSQVYICCSYQALRMANFMTNPSLDTIQANLILANVLAYNMNPGVAYIFLGMTIRMAFSIGLQIDSQNLPDDERYRRSRVWWALAWQDSHYSVSYDRPTSTVLCHPAIPYANGSTDTTRSYAESMYMIIRLTQEIVQERMVGAQSTMPWSKIQQYKEEVLRIVASSAPHLRDRNMCQYTTQHLQRLALKLHSSYIISELCRPALKDFTAQDGKTVPTPLASPTAAVRKLSQTSSVPSSSGSHTSDSNLPAQLRRDCIASLQHAVESYVEIHSISMFAARSWIGIQRAVSAAFLLGTLPETPGDPITRALLQELERVISIRTTEDPNFSDSQADVKSSPEGQMSLSNDRVPAAESQHWAKSMTKSLNALGKLNAALACTRHGQGNITSMPALAQGMYNTAPMVMGVSLGMQSRAQYPALANVKQEPFSPTMGGSRTINGMNMGPITPDSTGSSEWNLNIMERASEYVQPALWG